MRTRWRRSAELDPGALESFHNTTDPDLWRPVEEHCAVLGSRFRFLHVERITGAKAEALNWAMPYTDPKAEIIGVVDADYHVEPDWLRRTGLSFGSADVWAPPPQDCSPQSYFNPNAPPNPLGVPTLAK